MQRLTSYERQIIQSGMRSGKSARAMAKSMGRDHRVIQREITRNTGDGRPYTASSAEQMAKERERRKNLPKLAKAKHLALRQYVLERLREDWSPEQIAGVLTTQSPVLLVGAKISHESVYRYIYEGEGRFEHLWSHLRRGRTHRQKRHSRKKYRTSIPERVSIHLRPPEVAARQTFGHWESDTVECGKSSQNLSVQYERKSMLTRIHKIQGKSARATEEALRKSIETTPEYWWKTITFDNGTEGARHTKLRDDYALKTFFCDPYSSWQKGGVENTNGLIRQYVPRSARLWEFTAEDIYVIQERLNNRPRKSLNYLTPNQIFARETGMVGH